MRGNYGGRFNMACTRPAPWAAGVQGFVRAVAHFGVWKRELALRGQRGARCRRRGAWRVNAHSDMACGKAAVTTTKDLATTVPESSCIWRGARFWQYPLDLAYNLSKQNMYSGVTPRQTSTLATSRRAQVRAARRPSPGAVPRHA